MDPGLRDRFMGLWNRYFPTCNLPITFELSDRDCGLPGAKPPGTWRCVVCDLARVRKGRSLLLGPGSLSRSGAQYYLGYVKERSPDPDGVTCPFGSVCSSIIHYPLLEGQGERPRAVLGMFDPSERPCVPPDMLTMAFPMRPFSRIVDTMEESFLATGSWGRVREKIRGSAPGGKND